MASTLIAQRLDFCQLLQVVGSKWKRMPYSNLWLTEFERTDLSGSNFCSFNKRIFQFRSFDLVIVKMLFRSLVASAVFLSLTWYFKCISKNNFLQKKQLFCMILILTGFKQVSIIWKAQMAWCKKKSIVTYEHLLITLINRKPKNKGFC